ncbi:unnamed protein product [Symbiodinium natans]|uniref:Uncharacterized protein n=1 Tax=Symbiodinium natans TaxID=878477 RepID=A0A812JTZ7_9DINO|nr:unnamed protein product [Symbiodinium natans]
MDDPRLKWSRGLRLPRSQSCGVVTHLPKTRGKRPDHGIWPVGAPGPLWQPQTAEQRAWRAMTGSAVRAAASVQLTRKGAAKSQVHETPGIEAWDSVSQAPSVPGTPYTRSSGAPTEALSAESCDSSNAREHRQLNRIIRERFTRNREGWHDWHVGRVIG